VAAVGLSRRRFSSAGRVGGGDLPNAVRRSFPVTGGHPAGTGKRFIQDVDQP
jgi:hypothetical protein